MRRNRPFKVTAIALCLAGLLTAAHAGDAHSQTRSQLKAQHVMNPTFESGVQAFNAGDNDMALRIFLKMARRGDPRLQSALRNLKSIRGVVS